MAHLERKLIFQILQGIMFQPFIFQGENPRTKFGEFFGSPLGPLTKNVSVSETVMGGGSSHSQPRDLQVFDQFLDSTVTWFGGDRYDMSFKNIEKKLVN